jgi:hypothetical protein
MTKDVSEKSRHDMFQKYKTLQSHLDHLEPPVITSMYKEYKSAATFYPTVGVFFDEFALVYACSLHSSKKDGSK